MAVGEYEVIAPFDYCTLAEVKAQIAEGAPAADAAIETLIPILSRRIDRYKRVPVSYYNNGGDYAVPTIHLFDGNGKRELWIDRCTEIESVLVRDNGTGVYWVEGTDYYTWPWNTIWIARLDLRSQGSRSTWTAGQRNIEIAAKWGAFPDTPDEVKQACIMLVSRMLGRGQQMFRETSAIVELARLAYTLAIDPEVASILKTVPGRLIVG